MVLWYCSNCKQGSWIGRIVRGPTIRNLCTIVRIAERELQGSLTTGAINFKATDILSARGLEHVLTFWIIMVTMVMRMMMVVVMVMMVVMMMVVIMMMVVMVMMVVELIK